MRFLKSILVDWNIQHPSTWIKIYAGSIVFFSIIYLLLPSETFKRPVTSLADSLYFSVVTITTLGYGDIYPVRPISKVIVSIEAILGIVFIGMFLNALWQRFTARVESNQERTIELNWFIALQHNAKQAIRQLRAILRSVTETRPIEDGSDDATPFIDDARQVSRDLDNHFRTYALFVHSSKNKELVNTVGGLCGSIVKQSELLGREGIYEDGGHSPPIRHIDFQYVRAPMEKGLAEMIENVEELVAAIESHVEGE